MPGVIELPITNRVAVLKRGQIAAHSIVILNLIQTLIEDRLHADPALKVFAYHVLLSSVPAQASVDWPCYFPSGSVSCDRKVRRLALSMYFLPAMKISLFGTCPGISCLNQLSVWNVVVVGTLQKRVALSWTQAASLLSDTHVRQ